jgi:hypothetical protein
MNRNTDRKLTGPETQDLVEAQPRYPVKVLVIELSTEVDVTVAQVGRAAQLAASHLALADARRAAGKPKMTFQVSCLTAAEKEVVDRRARESVEAQPDQAGLLPDAVEGGGE